MCKGCSGSERTSRWWRYVLCPPLPSLHVRAPHLHVLLGLWGVLRLPLRPRGPAEPLCGVLQLLVGVSHAPSTGERRALHQIMHTRTEVRHTQALQAFFGQLDQGSGPVTAEGPHTGSSGLEPLLHQRLPRGVGAILCHLCPPQLPRGQGHEDQQHLFQKRFIRGPKDLSHLTPRAPVLLPRPRRLQPRGLQRVHLPASGRGRTPSLPLKTPTREKCAHRFTPHAAREAEGRERGDHQARQPPAALCCFPPPGFRMDVPALHGLRETRHAARGQPRLLGHASHALPAVVTQTREHPQALGR